jgi:hypothetical protein
VNTKSCIVTVVDIHGMRHSVQVQAESLYEAAAKGLRALRDHGWVPHAHLSRSKLEIVVTEPAKRHTIQLHKFEAWVDSSGAVGPKEFVKKQKLRALLYPPEKPS